MQRHIIRADIVEVSSDAMIYSTNVGLTLTGGVGAALLRKFGIGVQIALQDSAAKSGRHTAKVGDLFETAIPESPWKKVFHSIATDELYRTDAGVVRSILKRCLNRCVELEEVRWITCSALGSGYGDLDLRAFALIAEDVCREFDKSTLAGFAIVSYDIAEYTALCAATSHLGDWKEKS